MTIDEGIRKAVSALETVAPKAWEALVAEQRMRAVAELFEDGIGILCCAAICAISFWVLRSRDDGDDSPRSVAKWIIALCVLAWGCVFLSSLVDNIIVFNNPEPFAARALIDGARK